VLEAEEIEVREWTFDGSGYSTAGDVCLARNLEEGLRVARVLAREESDVAPSAGVHFGVGTGGGN
jgi:hypothetical protein